MSRNAPEWFGGGGGGGGAATFGGSAVSPTKSSKSSRSKKTKDGSKGHRRKRSNDRSIEAREESSQKSKKNSSKKQQERGGRPRSASSSSRNADEQKSSVSLAERFLGGLQRVVAPRQGSPKEVVVDKGEREPLRNSQPGLLDKNEDDEEKVVSPVVTPPIAHYAAGTYQTASISREEKANHHLYGDRQQNSYKAQHHPLQQSHPPASSSVVKNNLLARYSGEHDLSYSDDDTTTNFQPSYQGSEPKHSLYPQNNNRQEMHHHEAYQIKDQNQLIALARQSGSQYGSIIHSNEMYISEEESLASATSNSMHGHANLLWSSKKQKNPDFPGVISEEETRRDVFAERDEEDMDNDALFQPNIPHMPIANMSRNGRQSYDEEKSNHSSKSGSNKSPVPSIHQNGLPNSGSNSASSQGSKSNPAGTKLVNTINPTNPITRQKTPPVETVLVSRSGSNNTGGSGSSASQSPRLINGISQNSQQSQREAKKERKRRQRREKVEEIEERVQEIVRHGHENALDWSRHVPQDVFGTNRAAGFFPTYQKSHAKDLPFAILFFLQLCGVFYVAFQYGDITIMTASATQPTFGNENQNNFAFEDPFSSSPITPIAQDPMWTDIRVDYHSALQLACISALYATSLAALMIGVMMILSNAVIQTFLCLTVLACFSFGAIGIALSPYDIIPVMGLILLALSLGYCIVVWDRVPFATTNLNVALMGAKCSADLLIVAFGMMMVAFLWTILWTISFVGIYDEYLSNADEVGISNNSLTWEEFGVCIGMLVSYFWTLKVIMNIVHVTVAGVVGTWWGSPESLRGCCAYNLRGQFGKALTTSLGSICLGSLLVSPIHAIQTLFSICDYSTSSQRLGDSSHGLATMKMDSSVMSADELTGSRRMPPRDSPCERISHSCNDFGFTYVGLYGESFLKGSKKASDVFRLRNWHEKVFDQLIPHILMIATIIISLITGAFALVVEEYDGFELTNFRDRSTTAFLIGSYIGMVLSMVCLKVVGSSVNTVLVCFSVAPIAFQKNHSILSGDMRQAWGVLWYDDKGTGEIV